MQRKQVSRVRLRTRREMIEEIIMKEAVSGEKVAETETMLALGIRIRVTRMKIALTDVRKVETAIVMTLTTLTKNRGVKKINMLTKDREKMDCDEEEMNMSSTLIVLLGIAASNRTIVQTMVMKMTSEE